MNDSHTSTPRIGTFLSLGSPTIVELASECGFDWVLIDLEHGCETEATLPAQLRALRGSTTQAIVRVGAAHPELIARVLDWGAHGIMVPHVNTVAEAEDVVSAAHFAPRGHRGVSRTVRACGYGLRINEDAPFKPVILAQIETVEGLKNAASIAEVDGIDALFVGPADLSFDLKARKSDRDFDDCLKEVIASAAQHGKESGILVRGHENYAKMKALGFTWLAVDSDLSLVREGFLRNVKTARADGVVG